LSFDSVPSPNISPFFELFFFPKFNIPGFPLEIVGLFSVLFSPVLATPSTSSFSPFAWSEVDPLVVLWFSHSQPPEAQPVFFFFNLHLV